MRAILRARDHASPLWFETGEVFELPDLTDPATAAARSAPAEERKGRRSAPAPAPATALAAPPARRLEPTGPTEEGGPGASALLLEPITANTITDDTGVSLDDFATDEISRGAILRLVRPPPVPPLPGTAPDSLPPLVVREPTGPTAPHLPRGARLDDDLSTGLFEPMGWDEADPCSAVPVSEPEPRATAAPPVRLSVVQRAGSGEEFEGVVAPPLPAPPRPVGPAADLPVVRPSATLPEWYDADLNHTGVVIDPTRRGTRWTYTAAVAANLAAWAAGFVATFALGAVGAVAALGVAVATT